MKRKPNRRVESALRDADDTIRDAVGPLDPIAMQAFTRDVHGAIGPVAGSILGQLLGALIEAHGADVTRQHVEFLIAAIDRAATEATPPSEIA